MSVCRVRRGGAACPSGPANVGGPNNFRQRSQRPPAFLRSLHRRRPAPTAPAPQAGVTTGSARLSARGTDVTGPQTHGDAAIEEENRTIDRKVNSICRGCLSQWLRFVRDLVATRWIPAADLQRFCHESVILSGSDWMRENGHVAQNGDRIDGDSRRGNARA